MKDQEFLVLLDQRIEEIAPAILQAAIGQVPFTPASLHDSSLKLREQLAVIKSKEYVTVREAALLLSCSESHIRKPMTTARKNKTLRTARRARLGRRIQL